jgi:hypothetical protein
MVRWLLVELALSLSHSTLIKVQALLLSGDQP